MSIKSIITDNSAPSVSIAGKNLSRRTEGGQVIYDSAIEQSTSGSSLGAGNGTIKTLYVTGVTNTTQGDWNTVPAGYGTPGEPGIYYASMPAYSPPPYPAAPSEYTLAGLACPEGVTTFNRTFWSQYNQNDGRYVTHEKSGLLWRDGKLSVFNAHSHRVISGTYAFTLYYIPL